ncbi:MAG: DUF6516 family protein [Chloroflexi bacterium]|nr:DUF6516 family protein [Chloroflexota bacterium]
MNALLNQHFTMIEMQLLQSSAVVAYEVLSREVGLIDGKLRIKAILRDNAILELFEYDNEVSGQIKILKYSFHWQNAQGSLRKRWDNAPHYPHLPNAPHHLHQEDGSVEHVTAIPTALFVIGEIEQTFQP